jgi:hypothetical protein
MHPAPTAMAAEGSGSGQDKFAPRKILPDVASMSALLQWVDYAAAQRADGANQQVPQVEDHMFGTPPLHWQSEQGADAR